MCTYIVAFMLYININSYIIIKFKLLNTLSRRDSEAGEPLRA